MMRSYLPVFAITIAVSFYMLGSIPLFDVDEAVFAEATKEMVESGEWITPTYNGVNRYDKPILFYWLMASSYRLFGINEFGARFPSALAACLLGVSLFFFVRRLMDERRALYASLSLVLSIFFFVYSHAAVTDMTLTLFITLSLFSFYLSLSDREDGYPSPYHSPRHVGMYKYGLYLFSALAFLTKGLIGILFPFGIAFVYLLLTEGLKGTRKLANTRGIILFLAISLPWLFAQLSISGHEFIDQFLMKHHFRRYTSVISGHRGAVYYYVPVLVAGMFPWIAFLPAGVRDVFRKKRGITLLGLVWFAFIGIFFSLSTTKLPNYVLPAIPALSILISSGMALKEKQGRYENAFITCAAAVTGIALVISRERLPEFGVQDTQWIVLIVAALLMMAALCCHAAIAKKTHYSLLSGIMIVFLFMLGTKVFPVANQYLQGALYRYSLYAKENLSGDERVVAYRINNPSIVFYSGHRVTPVGNRDELLSLVKSGGRLIAIAKAKDSDILGEAGFTIVEGDRRYALFERK